MSENIHVDTRLAEKIYRAKSVPKSYQYNIDYWLIGRGDNYVDAKRIGPIMFISIYLFLAWFSFDIAKQLEIFSNLLTDGTFSSQTRVEYIIWRAESYLKDGYYFKLIDGIFLATMFFFLSLHFLFSPYPRPVRFNQKNGLVYTKYMGKIWVTDWNRAAIKIWRGKNVFVPWSRCFRGIQIRMHTLDKKGFLRERWVMLSAVNSHKINDLEIGGDPSLLYWHWLDEYMRGASFEGEAPSGSRNKCIPKPKIGRLPVLEAIMRFRAYKFSPKIDKQAFALDRKLKSLDAYPKFKEDKLPKNPYFTWEIDFPGREIPDAQGKFVEEHKRKEN